ncbi:MAG: EAL domain-containing protein [Gammaproteobacteria bacterium]|nr:EAL domain-containing protein [Gammaproteobacteria bacterium]
MTSLNVRIAIIIASVLFFLMLIVGFYVQKQLTQAIEQQGVEQAELHAQTVLGSLKTLMLNGNGTLAKEWLGRLQGVAGISNIEVLRRDGQPAFTDLSTVDLVNNFLGKRVFDRNANEPPLKFEAVDVSTMQKTLDGEIVHEFASTGDISITMPIQAETECLSCHGYDQSMFRGVLRLSLSNQKTATRINEMRTALWGGAFFVVLLLVLVLWFFLRWNVLKPIHQLRDAIHRVSLGDKGTKVPVYRRDELGQLAESFNRMQLALSDSETRIRAVMDNVVDGIVILKDNGLVEGINPAVTTIFGYTETDLLGKHIDKLVPEKNNPSDDNILGVPGVPDEISLLGIAREISGRRKNGTVFPMDVALSEMLVGKERFYICIIRDITSRKARTAALRYQAMHDALTDLPNRTLLMDRLQQALRSAERERNDVAILLLDLDRFKEVNDTLGHHVGDKLLQQIAHRLRMVLRESDTVARLGGDEFCVLLPYADTNQAMFTARKIINSVEKPVSLEGQTMTVGASIGIAVYPQHGDNPAILLQRSDVAMYVAKRGSKGFSVYDSNKDQHSLRHLSISSDLRAAIERDELKVYYQPKVNLRDNRVNGFEALVRWQHPDLGMLLPEEFVPVAEQSGLIRSLSLCVLRLALKECADFLTDMNELRLSVNLSMRDLSDSRFIDDIAAVLNDFHVPAGKIKFEITETALMEHPQKTIRTLNQLNSMGLRLSIDDYGIGYSGLSYLKQLPVNELKIDKSFGMSLMSDGNSAVIMRSTIDMAHELGLKVVAEGIETREAYELLRNLGCDSVQGFYISPPLPISDALHWVERNHNIVSLH